MTLIVDGTSGLTFPDTSVQAVTATNATNITSGTLPFGRLPSGSILQVVQTISNSSASTTSSSVTTTGLSGVITPKFSTSKILVMITSVGRVAGGWGQLSLYKNGSSIFRFFGGYLYNNQTGSTLSVPINFNYIDSPATTSATTYALYYSSGNGTTFTVNPDGETTTIILMEIAA
jgi:hypothetical protein